MFMMNRGTHPAPAADLQAMEFLQRDNVSQPEQPAPKIHPNTHTLSHTVSVELDINAGWGLVFFPAWARIHLSTSG